MSFVLLFIPDQMQYFDLYKGIGYNLSKFYFWITYMIYKRIKDATLLCDHRISKSQKRHPFASLRCG